MNDQTQGSSGRRALVLIVDPHVQTRHGLWRVLSRAFAVLEAQTAVAARRWLEERPDIDALIVDQELPDGRGEELVAELASRAHPLAKRSIVLTPPNLTCASVRSVLRGDVPSILSNLTSLCASRDLGQARVLLDRLRKGVVRPRHVPQAKSA